VKNKEDKEFTREIEKWAGHSLYSDIAGIAFYCLIIALFISYFIGFFKTVLDFIEQLFL